MNKKIITKIAGAFTFTITLAFALSTSLLFTSCYSVFSGGTGGMIVDAESTTTPKQGIANVDVYAYTSSSTREANYDTWDEGTRFYPSGSYYGHTTTDANGNFSISNIVWKEDHPDFGKDADSTTLYLLYFHEDYGLVKDQTLITSDSVNNSVYAELTSIRKTSSLNISIQDVSTSSPTTNNVLVRVTVPQTTASLTNAEAKVFEREINGNGTINISYPRWKSPEDKSKGIENTPEITITYSQSSDNITWKACTNADNEAQDYSFLGDGFSISKTIRNNSYNLVLYGKPVRINVPTVNGTCGNITDTSSDGKIISMKAKDSSNNFTIDCGETTTVAQTVGTSGTQTHGHFSGLGNGYFWTDNSYTGKYSTIEVQFFIDGTATTTRKTLRSDIPSYSFVL